MLIRYRDLEASGFVVAHDEMSGTLSIFMDTDSTGFNFAAQVNKIQEEFYLPDSSRDLIYDHLVNTVTWEVVRIRSS